MLLTSCAIFVLLNCRFVDKTNKLILLTVLLTGASRAHAVPTGCFMTDYGTSCYTGYFLASDCNQINMTSYYFGNYIYSMCSYVNSIEGSLSTADASLRQCNSDFSVVVSQRDTLANDKSACISAAATIDKNRQEWIAYARGREALVKKLQRACGAKCRRIK